MIKPMIITDPDVLAEALKTQRKRLRSTQQDLADMHGVSRYTIVDAESGNGDPKLSTVLTLLSGLGISLMAVPTQLVRQVEMLEVPELEVDEAQSTIDGWDFEPGMDP
ncbi:helix-turn-helix domain-containing protein [Pseudosulfitobacter pseudonitzschiae]|uniref:helix-turn-helix domain-containing protein n=1 Tax=Pseudosulfitobacter pseudonitzschiae TaxID=1402135 RepID=UPI003B82A4C2